MERTISSNTLNIAESSANPSFTTEKEVEYAGERRINFNENWRFQKETSGSIGEAHISNFDDTSWRLLDVPHDWSIELDFNPDSPATHEGGFLDGGIGWYRKTFTVPSSMEGKRVSIDFDGVYMNSTTYINGEALGTFPFGYNAFSYDITDKLYTDGRENVIAVRVNNTQPSSRWYSGSGIYRNVYLTVTNPVHVARYGTFVTTPNLETAYAEGRADINIKTKINNASGSPVDIRLKSTIYGNDGQVVAIANSEEKVAAAETIAHFEDNTTIDHPELWGIDNPYRYKLVTEVFVDGKIVDTYETLFGVRYFEFDANEGFSLNGQYMKLHGVCMHHDLGALGAATNARGVERQMQIMKDMGVNAIRVTHNPASPELLEACNNLGLLVVEESFDCWNMSKKSYDYGRFFTAWAEHDTKEMVDRGKNEPCIIMWSVGNEIYDTTNENGVKIARDLVRWVKEIDTTRPTTIGEDKTRGDKVSVTPINEYIEEIFNIVDIVGLNYSENNYDGYHKLNPEWKIYGAETSSATRSRGVYTHPYTYNESTKYDDLQQSSYDNDYVAWGRTAEDSWKADRDLKHLAGQFIWTGFDYIGEPTPYYTTFPAKSSYFGIVDTAGFPKDVYYYYMSQWKQEPMVHILPHWNWNEEETVRVLTYTNADKVELFLNGVSLGERSYEIKKTSWGSTYKETEDGKTYLEWAVPFEAGKLEAVAKNANGQIIARDQVITAGAPAAVRLTADRKIIDADGVDLSFVTVDIIDGDGNIVPTANHLVEFDIDGQGVLAGVDNGDAASVERYKDSRRKVFNGKAIAIIQADKQSGEITLSASVAGLATDTIRIFTLSPEEQDKTEIAGVDSVNLTIESNSSPELPAMIDVYYSDLTVESKEVAWDKADPGSAGNYIVEGSIEGTDKKAKAFITVIEVIAVKPFATAVKIGAMPELPAKVALLYSDGTTKVVNATWEGIPSEQLSKTGRIVVNGSVKGTDLKAKAHIRVTAEEPALGTTAKLSSIAINGETLADFNHAKAQYELVLPYDSERPTIEAEAADNAVVTILPAFTFPGLAKIYVTSEDNTINAEYSILVQTEKPMLVSAEISVPQTHIVEDDIIQITIKGQLESNEIVELDVQPTYEIDNPIVKVDGNRLYAFDEGQVKITATIVHDGVTVTTPEMVLHIAKNPTVKTITSLGAVSAVADQGGSIALPKTTVAHYNTGLPREVNVTWDEIDQARINELGEFTVSGTVEYTDIKAMATITVKGPVAIENTALAILPNQLPELPEKLTVYYSDGSEMQTDVTWTDIPVNMLDKVGIFTVEGFVKDVDLKATAQIRVTKEIGIEQNIARAKNGYDYPKADASFVNNGPGSNDSIEALHDDVISYGEEPHNRWTNWQPVPRTNDWVSITFGDYGPVENYVDNIEIHWFEDEGTSYPSSFNIQYKSGDQWIDVTNLKSELPSPTAGKANIYTFDMVKTSAIRVDMAAQDGKAIGITEIKIFSKKANGNSNPVVTDIQLDEKGILADFIQTGEGFENTVTVESMPQITAQGAENTSITIVPTVQTPSTAKVITKSEDSKKTIVYNIHLR